MRGKSSIAGRQVIVEVLEGKVILDDDAHFNVTGLSMNTNGTMSHGAGASFMGMSGTCAAHQTFKTYGEFDMTPIWRHVALFKSMMGSMGNRQKKLTGGGGRVVLKADSLDFRTPGLKI